MEAALVTGARIWSAQSLLGVCAKLRAPDEQEDVVADLTTLEQTFEHDWSDVRGQATVKRALAQVSDAFPPPQPGDAVLLEFPPHATRIYAA